MVLVSLFQAQVLGGAEHYQPSTGSCCSEKEGGRRRHVRKKRSVLTGCGGREPKGPKLFRNDGVRASQLSIEKYSH